MTASGQNGGGRRLRRLVAGCALSLVLALTLVLGTAGSASAHDSGYCGHGVSGWWPWQVHFESSFNASAYVHYHIYGHYYITLTGQVFRDHGDVKRC